MTTMTPKMGLQDLKPQHVRAVYTGTARACMCGCKGKYRFNSAHVEESTKARGYAVGAEEVSDAQVLKVLRTVQANGEALEDAGDILSVDLGRRTFVLYLAKGVR